MIDFEFLNAFWDLFFYPLYQFSFDEPIYMVIYAVVVTLVVWAFVRRLLQCMSSM